MTLEDVLARLDGVQTRGSGRFVALCPVHQERTPSLSVRRMPDGGVALHCFGCGAGTRAVREALGIEANGPRRIPAPEPEEGSPAWWEAVRREALRRLRQEPWYDSELRYFRARIEDLHAAADRLGPDDPAAWDMLEVAALTEHEFRLLDQTRVPGLDW